MLETESQQFSPEKPSQIPQVEKVPGKSSFISRCERIMEDTKNILVKEVEEAPIDMELKTIITKLIGEHFRDIRVSELTNSSSMAIVFLQNKIFDAIREFREKVIVEGQSYRQTGNENGLAQKTATLMMQGGVEIEKAAIQKNSEVV